MVIRGLADSGFFLPHSAASGRNDYDSSMRRVFLFANMSAGANKAYHSNDSSDGGLMATTLPTSRVSQDERERSHCAFASNLYPHISSPTLLSLCTLSMIAGRLGMFWETATMELR